MRALSLSVLVLASGCAGPGEYVWVSELPVQAPSGEYTIESGDVLGLRVLGHEEMTTHARVRWDGRFVVPILGEIDVRGKHPSEVRAMLEAKYAPYFTSPSVTVNIDEWRHPTVTVLGEVAHQGSFPLERGLGVAEALSAAGGLTDYASRDRIFVVRRGPQSTRIRFTFHDVTNGDRATSLFVLRDGDMVVVE